MDWKFMARIMAIGSVVLAAGGTGEKDYPGMLNTLTGISLLTVMEVLGPIVSGRYLPMRSYTTADARARSGQEPTLRRGSCMTRKKRRAGGGKRRDGKDNYPRTGIIGGS